MDRPVKPPRGGTSPFESPVSERKLRFSNASRLFHSPTRTSEKPEPLTLLESLLRREARGLARLLLSSNEGLVLAESCTAGRASAALGEISGVSRVLAGSWVVYQIDSKTRWLGLPPRLFKSAPDAVSSEVAEKMAVHALRKTPSAAWGAAITGHLSPPSPPAVAWLAIARRTRTSPQVMTQLVNLDEALRSLPSPALRFRSADSLRACRQVAASILLLRMVRALISRAAET
jgi:nicotinamide mononucleotide (NMN) deamidase PncC